MSRTRSAAEVVGAVLDEGSYRSWDTPSRPSRWPEDYRLELREAARRSGADEAVITGSGTIDGHGIAVIVSDFRFMAGSIGREAADRIVTAVRRATAERLPILAHTSSGGTRMQEGTPAFLSMISISRAIMEHRVSGLLYLVHLGDPTTGGVLASWGSLGQVTVAEPGALVGFLGPRVYEVLENRPFPPGVQLSDHLIEHDLIDRLVSLEELRVFLRSVLGLVLGKACTPRLPLREQAISPRVDAWSAIEATREPGRIGVREVLQQGASDIVPLEGTFRERRPSPVRIALARLDGQPCVVIGQDREAQREAPLGVAALRACQRAMTLANELGLPLVSFIDTPGAELSVEAEEAGIAAEIARCIAAMSTMSVPTVSVLLGQGCGGGALALFPGERVIAAQNSWLSPLAAEGASGIMFGDASRAPEIARGQRVTAAELLKLGAVSAVVPELASDLEDGRGLARAIAAQVAHEIETLRADAYRRSAD